MPAIVATTASNLATRRGIRGVGFGKSNNVPQAAVNANGTLLRKLVCSSSTHSPAIKAHETRHRQIQAAFSDREAVLVRWKRYWTSRESRATPAAITHPIQ